MICYLTNLCYFCFQDIDEVLHSSLKQVEIFALKKEAILKQEDLTQDRKDGLIKQVQWLS